MRVVLATQDRENVNGHFASTRLFMFYDVTAEGHRFLEEVTFDVVTGEEGRTGVQEDGEDRLAPKLKAIEGSVLMFVTAIGGPAAARVVRTNVHPVKLPKAEPIGEVLERVQTMLKGNPPPWLRKILATQGELQPAS